MYAPFVQIGLDDLVYNLAQLRRCLPASTGIMAVVKDCAYGCGAIPVSRTLEREGVGFFAVARTAEAMALREANIGSPILVLGEADGDEIAWGASNAIDFALNDCTALDRWSSLPCQIRAQCCIDTGMGRLGLVSGDIPDAIERCRRAPNVSIVGAYSHFACADAPDVRPIETQLALFGECLSALRAAGFAPRHIHCANSAAILRRKAIDFTWVRPGIALYGCTPDPSQDFGVALRSVTQLKGYVIKVKQVPAGTGIGYGWRYRTAAPTLIATAGIGYGHGLPRYVGNKGHLLIRGQRFPIVGSVTMDYTMVDLGSAGNILPGDEVVAIGRQGAATITADDVALHGGTIGYEVLCHIATHIDRRYRFEGRPDEYVPARFL